MMTLMELRIQPVSVSEESAVLRRSDEDPTVWFHVPNVIDATLLDGDYLVRFRVRTDIDDTDGVPQVEEFSVKRKPDGPWVKSETMRSAGLHDAAVKEVVRLATTRFIEDEGKLTLSPSPLTHAETLNVRRRPRWTADKEQAVIAAFVEANADPAIKDAYKRVATMFGCSRATIGRRIQKARSLGLVD